MKTFTLTTEHIKLLRAMNVGWQNCESGAPEIDPKRPYGNSDVPKDIHGLLTGSDDEPSEQEQDRYMALHRETETALQIVLATGKFLSGVYVCDDYRSNWRAK